MSILNVTILDTTEGLIQLGADWTRLIALEDVIGFVLIKVVNTIDRRNDSSSTAHSSFVKVFKLLNWHRTNLYLQTEVTSYLLDGHIGDRRKN